MIEITECIEVDDKYWMVFDAAGNERLFRVRAKDVRQAEDRTADALRKHWFEPYLDSGEWAFRMEPYDESRKYNS